MVCNECNESSLRVCGATQVGAGLGCCAPPFGGTVEILSEPQWPLRVRDPPSFAFFGGSPGWRGFPGAAAVRRWWRRAQFRGFPGAAALVGGVRSLGGS
jgi:hypothetical protein